MAREGPIKLSEAPAHFFADDWARLASLKGGEAKALEALGHPDPGLLIFYRRQRLELNLGTPASRVAAMAEEEADALVHRLRDGLCALGSEERIVASGLYVGTGQRQAIPWEFWATAEIDFGAGTVSANGFAYHNVRAERANAPADAESVATAMRAWLDRRRAKHGDELKKKLIEAARRVRRGVHSSSVQHRLRQLLQAQPRPTPKKRNK